MITEITPEFLKQYTEKGKRHKAYATTVTIMTSLKVHADGESPGELITDRRPNESVEVKNYREKIFVAITESVISKIISSLSKIRKSQDWSIAYPKDVPASIKEGESLQDYCESNYPFFTSITNWLFDVCLKNYLIDPNGLVVVMPLKTDVAVNEYKKPFSYIFNSDCVYDYVQDDYAVIYSTDKSTYTEGNQTYNDGDIYYIITTQQILKYEQVKRDKTFEITIDYNHELGLLPVFKLGGIFKEAKDTTFIYKSRIGAVVPRLNEAVREYSDMQAEVVQHVHSEKWVIHSQECNVCNGTGKVTAGKTGKPTTCSSCKGQGMATTSPFSYHVVNPKALPGQSQPITPPLGYVQKQIDIVKIQDERIDKHIYQALSAINMEFLVQTPLNQSGVAKEVDRDELNNFVNAVAENLVAILDKNYFLVNEYRYMKLIADKRQRLLMLPRIAVPQRFDLLNPNYLIDEIDKAKKGVLNPVITVALELEYVAKEFTLDDMVGKTLKAVLTLDPFPGMATDEKASLLMNGGITKQDFVISSYIQQFARRAINEDTEFLLKTLPEQTALMQQYADEKIKQMSAKETVMSALPPVN